MRATADRMLSDGLFTRLPAELESGYLGKGGKAKTMQLDFDDEETPGYVKESIIGYADDTISDICNMLTTPVDEKLGYQCYSRSNVMLVLPFAGEHEEGSFPHPELVSTETESFVSLMKRGKL